MPNSGLKHIDVGTELTKAEWESEESHEIVHGNAFPSSPVERQVFYRDDEHVWYIYNGSQWVNLQANGLHTDSAVSPQVPSIITIFPAGHGWVRTYAQGTVSDDTVDYLTGDRSLKIETVGNGTNTNARKTNAGLYDFTNKRLRIWVKLDEYAKANVIAFYASSDNFASAWYWWNIKPAFAVNTEIRRDGEWIPITLSFSTASVTGSPNKAAINSFQLVISDNNTGAAIIRIDEVSYVPEPTEGVVSITFDDGWVSQFTEGFKKMSQYGFPGTAYIIPHLIGSSEYLSLAQLKILQNVGEWDISAHENTNLTTISLPEVEAKILAVKEYLINNGFSKGADDIAYPYGAINSTILPVIRKYFRSGRTIISFKESYPPTEPHYLKVLLVLNTTTPATINAAVDAAIANKDWLILVFHKIVSNPSVSTEYSITNFGTVIDYIASTGIAVKTVADMLNGIALVEETITGHKDLTTGVHGVGASTVESTSGAQSKVNTHASATTGVHGVGTGIIARLNAASGLNDELQLSTDKATGTTNQLIKLGFTTNEAKANIAYYDENGLPVVWLSAHNYLDYPENQHQHFSIETAKADGTLTSRLGIGYGEDTVLIATYDADVSLASGKLLLYKEAIDSVLTGNFKILEGNLLLDSTGTVTLRLDRGGTGNFSSIVLTTAGTDQWTIGLRNDGTNNLHFRDNVSARSPLQISRTTGYVSLGATIRAIIDTSLLATTDKTFTLPNASGIIALTSDIDTHAELTSAHSATSAPTADRIILRDANGRAQVAAPSAADDIARKADVDAKPSTFLQLTDTPSSYAGHANKLVAVNPAANALEFVTGAGGDLFGLTRFLRAGRYHVMPFGTNTTLALTANTLYAVPFFTPVARTITRLAIHVTTAGTGTQVRLGVYSDGGNIYPNSLVFDAGTVDSASTGFKEITGLNISFSANTLYWLALVSGGTPTLAATSAGLHWSLLGFGTALNTVGSGNWSVAFTMGALPSTFPTGASPSTTAIPKVAIYF